MSTDPIKQPPFIELLLGPCWRTSLSGMASTAGAVAAAIAILPADIWQNWHVWLPAVVAIIAKTVQDLKMKDSRVAGTGAPDDPHRVDDGGATPRNIPVTLIVGFLIAGLALSGCAQFADALESPGNAQVIAIASGIGGSYAASQLGGNVSPDQQAIIQQAATGAIQTGATDLVWWFAEWLRSHQSTPQSANAVALAKVPVSAPVVTQGALAVKKLSVTGVPPDVANEIIARTLDAAAAASAPKPSAGKAVVPLQAKRSRPHFRTALPTLYSQSGETILPEGGKVVTLFEF